VETLGRPDYLGKVLVPVLLSINGVLEKRLMISADIRVNLDVVVLKRPFRRFETIRESDLKIERRDISRLSKETIFDPARAVGARTRKALDVNTVLTHYLVEMPPVVKKGDVVRVVLQTDCLDISTTGIVKSREGRRGSRIMVTNSGSRKTIFAKVLDSKTVRVEF
jgi:flagella basal body P-ring formation protein FlgA